VRPPGFEPGRRAREDDSQVLTVAMLKLLQSDNKKTEQHISRVLKGKTISQAAAELNVRVDTLLAWIGELRRIGKISDFIFV